MNIERKIHVPKELQIFLDLLTTDYTLFSTQTYGSYIEFAKYPFYENYFVVYRDNRMLRRLIDGEFYRNNKNSTIKYFFVVHQGATKYVHAKSNRLHSHMLMSTPDYRHVKNKYKVDLKSRPYRTMNHVVNKCLTKYKRFGRTDVRSTFDVESLKGYLTREISLNDNWYCLDFLNSDLPRLPELQNPLLQFKKFASQKKKNEENNLRLFDALDNTDELEMPDDWFDTFQETRARLHEHELRKKERIMHIKFV